MCAVCACVCAFFLIGCCSPQTFSFFKRAATATKTKRDTKRRNGGKKRVNLKESDDGQHRPAAHNHKQVITSPNVMSNISPFLFLLIIYVQPIGEKRWAGMLNGVYFPMMIFRAINHMDIPNIIACIYIYIFPRERMCFV